MTTLFKYTDYYGVEYFNNPTLRLSLLNELNDPFESEISSKADEFFEYAAEVINEKSYELRNNKVTPQEIREHMKVIMKTISIISFSETHRNLLMWAHYANSHSGICLELYNDWSESKPYLRDRLASSVHRLIRIKYDTARPEFNYLDEGYINSWDDTMIQIIVAQLSSKSDEWIYEKEHRYIMTLLETDFLLAKKGHTIDKNSYDRLELDVKNGLIKKNHDGYLVDSEKGEESIYTAVESNSLMFLCKIPPDTIKSIYLGHKFPQNEKNKLLAALNEPSHPLRHVNVYQCIISQDRFELESFKIHPKDPIFP